MSAKRQQTMAKIARERAVKERRERKLEKNATAWLRSAGAFDGKAMSSSSDRRSAPVQATNVLPKRTLQR